MSKRPKRGVPEGLWLRCPGCNNAIYRKEAEKRQNVCPQCDHHFYVSARERLVQLLDDGTFDEWDAELRPTDPLEFKDKKNRYSDRLKDEQSRTGLLDAVLTGTGMIRARRVAIGVYRFQFLHGEYGIGRRRAIDTARGASHRAKVAIDHRQRFGRWGSHARRDLVADADGQDLRGVGAIRSRGRIIHLGAHQSHHGRRGSQLRVTGGCRDCGTQGSDRIRRAAHDQGGDQTGTSQGISNQ